MRLEEARSVLGLTSDSTPEQAKKKYRELTKKFHPDVNKEDGAEAKFKKINEAYSVFTADEAEPDLPDWIKSGPFGGTAHRMVSDIAISETISFKESVLGCKKEITISRDSKCKDCHGKGQIAQNNGCTQCKGRGTIMNTQGHMVSVSTCPRCYGRMAYKKCSPCNATGFRYVDTTVNVSIPPGVQNDNALRLAGLGHYVGSFGPMDQNTDVILNLKVTPEPGLRIEGKDVVSDLKVSLLDALKGISKSVKTIYGNKDVLIHPGSKNREEINITGLGVGGAGNHKVVLSVDYPSDIQALLTFLEERKA